MAEQSTILLIEDDEDDLLLFRYAFNAAGLTHKVQHVPNGRDAVDYLLGEGRFADRETFAFPRFIISDYFAKFDGVRFLEWLRAHPECRVIPCVILSGSRGAGNVEEAYALGAHSYFEKPADPTQFQELLKLIFGYWQNAVVPEPKAVQECARAGQGQ